jgi:hypothetical protein
VPSAGEAPKPTASMNPARTIAPQLLAGEFANVWIYVAGPLAGAALAVNLAERGRLRALRFGHFAAGAASLAQTDRDGLLTARHLFS